jgi:hypothetical protein
VLFDQPQTLAHTARGAAGLLAWASLRTGGWWLRSRARMCSRSLSAATVTSMRGAGVLDSIVDKFAHDHAGPHRGPAVATLVEMRVTAADRHSSHEDQL